ncbi:MAG: efflux transporter outer membrane subunit [Planctomycetaceae bacterium]|nr:MAG: efflux transporter outer membrane subunit [Planctomycetaceae bacterium]
MYRQQRGAWPVCWPVILIGLILFNGCTTGTRQWARQGFKVGPEYTPPPATASERWMAGGSDGVNDLQSLDGAWWTVFDDPVLASLIACASEQNLGFKQSAARVWEARARLDIAKGNIFPQMQEATGGYTRIQQSRTTSRAVRTPFFDEWSTGLNASWEWDLWGRYRRSIEAAEADLQAANEDFRDVLLLLQAEVANAYIQTRIFQERRELALQNVALQERTLELAELRFREGQVTKLDVTQAQEQLTATRALVPQLEIGLRESQNALCLLLGEPPYDLASELGSEPIPAAPAEVVVGIPAELLTRRPDIRQAERLVAAQSARIGIAESELYPRIAITGMFGYESRSLSSLFTTESFTGSVGPGFRWNILNYGRIRSSIRAEEARLDQLVLQYQERVLQAHEEVETGIERFLREQERVGHLAASVAAAEESVKLAAAQYRIGRVDFQRLVDSERALVQRQDQWLASRGEVARHLVTVYTALGGGWQIP